jgi:uncharacterized Zn finger protein
MTTLTTTPAAASTVSAALAALVRVMDPARAQRAASVEVEGLKLSLNGATLNGVSARTGEGGKYNTRIVFAPRRSVACSCPDATQRKVACKHVSALAARLAGMV